jgi:hypothetical protein
MSGTGAASPTEVEHPIGSVPGICSAAVGLLATLVAFIAYADFRLESGARWRWTQVSPIVLAFAAMICLALVPLLAAAS